MQCDAGSKKVRRYAPRVCTAMGRVAIVCVVGKRRRPGGTYFTTEGTLCDAMI